MMEDKLETLYLVKGTRYELNTPLKFFMHFDKLREGKVADTQEFVRMVLNTAVFEAGDVKKESESSILFKIFIKNYLLLCRMDKEYKNISINKVLINPDTDSKIRFIEGKRKTISTSGFGNVFYYEDNRNWGYKPNETAKKHLNDNEDSKAMPEKAFNKLFHYFNTAAKPPVNERAEYFEKTFLDAVTKYNAIEFELEKKKCLEAPGVVYTSYKSVKAAGDSNRKYIYEFICPEFNSEDYPPGTEISIELEGAERKSKIFGSMVDIQDHIENSKRVTITFKNQFNEDQLPSVGVMKKNANISQKRVRDNVVQQFKSGDVKARYMLESFNGTDKFPTKGFDQTADTDSIIQSMKARNIKCNDCQKEAIEKGIQTKDIALVLGPPGTGKTTVIVEWVLNYIKQKKRILISSKNHKAVDNVFERVAQFKKQEEYKDLGMIRLGNADKIQANVREFLPVNQHEAISKEILTSVSKTKQMLLSDAGKADDLYDKLTKLELRAEKYFQLKRDLTEKYNKYAELIKEAKTKHDLFLSARDKFFKADRLAMLKLYLDEIGKKNFFVRLLHTFATNRIKKEYEKGEALFNNLRERFKTRAQDYNKAAKQVFAFKNDTEFIKLKKLYVAEEKDLQEYLAKIGTKFSLKTNIKFAPLGEFTFNYNQKALKKYIDKVQSLKKNIQSMDDTISGWEKVVSEKDNAVLSGLLINNAQVVGATCIGINTNPHFLNVDFDVSIIDEAGQIQIHDAIVPMSRSNKTLMLGDHKQIPPGVDQDMLEMCHSYNIDTELLEKSFFEFMYSDTRLSDDIKIMLDTQFRMPEEVADILSYQFYGGKYYTAEFKQNMPTLCPGVFKRPLVIIDTADFAGRFETKEDGKCYNSYEAQIVVNILKQLKENDLDIPYEEIGIITPYRRQMEEIRKQVRKGIPNLSKDTVESVVATLDSFQGQERDMIIYSCTRSNKRKSIGFLKELRRLNVALSRCKKQIVIIGDFDFLTTCIDTSIDEEEELKDKIAGKETDEDMPVFDDEPLFDNDEDEEGEEEGDEEEEEKTGISDLKDYERQLIRDTALTGTTRRFSEFMEYLLKKVQAGSGQYIKSKELNK